MNVVEKRLSSMLRRLAPLAAKVSRQRLQEIVNDAFGLDWVEPSPPKAFKYQAQNGLVLNVRPELRGSNYYWFVNKQIGDAKHHIYLAPAGKLEKVLLENAAKQITG